MHGGGGQDGQQVQEGLPGAAASPQAFTYPYPQAAAETVGLLLHRLQGEEVGERLGQVVNKRLEKMATSKSTEEKDR